MPTYDYICPANGRCVEVLHGIEEKVETWDRLCELARLELGGTPASAPVKKLLSAPSLAFPKSNSELKNMGFTKLVKREKGVYENVTANGNENRYLKSGDPSTGLDLSRKIRD